jgi:antitoxin MazE
MKVKLAKWGNSLGLRLPKAAVDATGLRPGSEVDVSVDGQDLRVRQPAQIKQYRLENLVAEMKRLGPENRPVLEDWSAVEVPWPDDDWSDIAPSAEEMRGTDARKRSRRP